MPIEKESPEQFGYDKIKVNLTESSIADKCMHDFGLNADFNQLLLSYGDHKGLPELRSLLAKNYGNCSPENIIVSAGAVLALFIINATLLDPKNEVVVLHPNYGANIEVPRSLHVPTHLVSLNLASNFALDVDAVKKAITPATRLLSITYPHNPTGSLIALNTLKEIIGLAEEHDCYVLVDETYRELTFSEKLPTAASLSDRVISVESLSKAFGVPGIRIGWLACQDDGLIEKFLATKEQVSICNSLVDENLAYAILSQKDKLLPPINKDRMEKFALVKAWLANHSVLEWVEPKGGVICFPHIRTNIAIDVEKFYSTLNQKYGTFVGPGHWFEMDDRFFRLGYAWCSRDQLKEGLKNIDSALEASRK